MSTITYSSDLHCLMTTGLIDGDVCLGITLFTNKHRQAYVKNHHREMAVLRNVNNAANPLGRLISHGYQTLSAGLELIAPPCSRDAAM